MRRLSGRRPLLLVLLAALLASGALLAIGAFAPSSGGGAHHARSAASVVPATPVAAPLRPHPRVVVALPPGATPPSASGQRESEPVPRPPSNAEIHRELAAFRQQLSSAAPIHGTPGTVLRNGTAVVPANAPAVVASVIAAGNAIATTPYKWGGGHGGWADNGYDCSGSVSFALAGARLLNGPLTSTGFMSWGDPGPGRWISIYANDGHVFMIVGNLRFDTSGETAGTRWQAPQRSTAGFVVRHPPGL